MTHGTRAIREGFEAARAVFEAEGYRCELRYDTGSTHPMCVATGPLGVIRHPLAASPRGGSTVAAKLAATTARRHLRRLQHRLKGRP